MLKKLISMNKTKSYVISLGHVSLILWLTNSTHDLMGSASIWKLRKIKVAKWGAHRQNIIFKNVISLVLITIKKKQRNHQISLEMFTTVQIC